MSDEAGGNAVVVAVNRGAEPLSAKFAAPASWTGAIEDVVAEEAIFVVEGNVDVSVPPRGARVVIQRGGSK
jgi:hypothetical protein